MCIYILVLSMLRLSIHVVDIVCVFTGKRCGGYTRNGGIQTRTVRSQQCCDCVSVFISNAVRVLSTLLCICIYQQCCTCVVNVVVYLYLSAMLYVCCQRCCVFVFISNAVRVLSTLLCICVYQQCCTCVVNVVVYSTLPCR